MNILVTGNLGYIGSVLTGMLQDLGHQVGGLDVGYFSECSLLPAQVLEKQTTKDIRDVTVEDFAGYDAVIHLAGLSNDPLGELNPEPYRGDQPAWHIAGGAGGKAGGCETVCFFLLPKHVWRFRNRRGTPRG